MPLSFHVDYWDYLGWRDPWASKAFSDRQRAYVKGWRSDSVYTPGVVLNGREWRSWSAERNGPRAPLIKAGVLQVTTGDRAHWQVTFAPVERDTRYEVYTAILANELSSDVKSGENRGQRLRHDFVVTTLAKHPLTNRDDKAEGEFALTADPKNEHPAIAFWVTRARSLEPLQAVGGWLSD